jgi:hypothetical protein
MKPLTHLCSDHCGEGPAVLALPVPDSLKARMATLATRRQFLSRAGKSLAWASLAGLFGRRGTSAHASAPQAGAHPAFRAEGEARDLSVHGRRALADRDLGLQAGLAERFDQDLPESVRGGQVLTGMTASQTRFPIAPSIFGSAATARPATGSAICSPTPRRSPTNSRAPLAAHRRDQPRARHPAHQLRQHGARPPIDRLVDLLRPRIHQRRPADLRRAHLEAPALFQNIQALSSRLWSAGFLSPEHAGCRTALGRRSGHPSVQPQGRARRNPPRDDRRRERLNRQLHDRIGDPETNARIAQYEMAFRMQTSVPELTDLSDEPESTWEMYGPKPARSPAPIAYNCLMARRLAERGVRFTQVFHRGWDTHGDLPNRMKILCEDVDQPTAALITDLKQRGLLDDTLVVWGGEFGRTVYSQGGLTETNYGRDHHPRCFSMWMAGGGVKPGIVYGETDDFSYNIVKDPCTSATSTPPSCTSSASTTAAQLLA